MAPLKAAMEGLTVIDFTTIVAGPWATRLMADCGAEVIKIETAGEGDLMRFAPPVVGGASRVFAQFNRGKKSVLLDLKAPADLDRVRRLINTADVVVENFRPGVMARLGLGYDELAARHPRLVYGSISGFGQDGPLAGAAAYAPVAHAMSGFDHAMTAARLGRAPASDAAPAPAGVMIADVVAAAYAFGAIQTALLRRERFGLGAHVDISLMESMMSLVGIQYQEAQADPPLRSTVFHPKRALDGYVTIPLVTARNYEALFSLIGPAADIEAHLAAWCASRTTADCARILNGAGIACGVHLSPAEALADPHMAARGAFGEVEDAAGPFAVLNPPFRLRDTPHAAPAQVAKLGEHTAQVLSALDASRPALSPRRAQ